jgi:hypothetical protein
MSNHLTEDKVAALLVVRPSRTRPWTHRRVVPCVGTGERGLRIARLSKDAPDIEKGWLSLRRLDRREVRKLAIMDMTCWNRTALGQPIGETL